jgi:hypothetical protein
MGNVVVNAVVRTLTCRAVGKAMKSPKPAGKRKKAGSKKRPVPRRRVPRRASEEAIGEVAGSREARRIKRCIPIEADAKKNCAGRPRSVPRPSRG